MKAAGLSHGIVRDLLSSVAEAKRGLSALVAASAVAVVYFLAARLGLALLSSPSDVAVFWPASGIAVGILILSGRRALLAVVVGVIAGTVAANVISDRSTLTSLCKGFCNAGEAALVAWLLERWFGRPFRFADLRRVGGFFAAAGLATAVSAIGGASTMTLLHTTAPYWEVWRAWFLSDGVGIVVVAPVMIGIGQMWRKAPSQKEWIEGVGVLSLAALASFYAVSQKTGSWLSFSPGGVVLPPLLWLTARCRPAFGLAGAFIASVSVILATTFGVGHFGDTALPFLERVKGAQIATVTVTVYTLVLIALFAQRNGAEEDLRESKGLLAKERAVLARLHEVSSQLWLKRDLRQALDEILAGAIEFLAADMGILRIFDPTRGVLKIEAHRGFKQEFIASFREVSAGGNSPIGRALRSGQLMVSADVEADELFAAFRPLARSAGYRAILLIPIMSRKGALLGTLATHFHAGRKPDEHDLRLLDLYVRQAADIIERHKAEEALRESEERLRLAQLRTGIGIWDRNLRTGKVTWTPELEALFGLEPGSVTSYPDFRGRTHPDDIEAFEAERDAAVRDRKTFNAEIRIIRADGQVQWMSVTGGAVYDEATGKPVRILGNFADITDRKRAEQHQHALNAELDHRVKNVLATVSAIIAQTQEASSSRVDFMTGLNSRINSLARTHELLSESNWRGASLAEIVQREFAPYTRGNTVTRGPSVTLKPEAAQAVATVLHELVTNAAKYGALSNRNGRVSVQWRWLQNGRHDRLLIEWQESGGPPVLAPSRPGYGTTIIRELIPFEFGGEVELSFAPDGVKCRLEISGEWVSKE